MFQKIIRFSIAHKAVIGLFTVALIVWGSWSLSQLPFDATPDITSNQVQVISQAPAMGAQEVEQLITTPIEMALMNIPEVTERRSISRSGLSVVTLVFDDDVDVYWAREQVNQALQEAEEALPSAQATVGMAPISTGLGEIYHYTVRPAKGYEQKYSLEQIREIQDWIVRKQLSGTEGVAEVSGWGGFVKQYEVAVDADRLMAAGLSLADVYNALETNNSNAGGSYIEKGANQYFIRGIGVAQTLADIRAIPIATRRGTTVRINDIAEVRLGHATRYGAVTRNGEGEVVAGISLMLKGENFQKVSRNVKARIAQIQQNLPEGIVIEPFIDRTDLVVRVTNTIATNLIEGGLIVIFILVLFLGNLRAGLVVASVIPLSMLFAFAMMKLFGISGNLMSLGAIDFGLIVDGAVIIVEAVCHHIFNRTNKLIPISADSLGNTNNSDDRRLSQKEMDNEVFRSASKIRKSAAFGEIIIMIVYLPLFTLGGIEGKMFRPMALTIFFAILGAFILSLTYVPMAASLFLSKRVVRKRNFSDKMMDVLYKLYRPVLIFCLNQRKFIIGSMVVLFASSVWLFTKLGGEFIPTLEEGDFAVEISMAQGTSLSQMVATTTLAEKIIKERFPEVKQAVTRIGSAEIPTDPMPVERADMLISLKPKAQWTSAKTMPELMEKMEDALALIPGMEAEMSQPIQMRNNELITGIKQDVAIMIYGDDLEKLSYYANRVAKLIEHVKGVTEPNVERVQGLPQIHVDYDIDRLAAYGITVNAANEAFSMAFAGRKAGVIYEGEKQFDLVVRLDDELRQDIDAVKHLQLSLPDGSFIPLENVADISFKEAPAQITHDNGERRIYVGFNVRGRDVQSTVAEIRQILNEHFHLPPGYYYTYGGEFKNLQEATERLSLAVPIALMLILLLLYATLHNIRETFFVFSAIPLSLIGGVMALWLRDMPFSISAGVGFIALFGISVLNGIVLVGQIDNLKREGMKDVRQRVLLGCEERLRPVIMTALVASLGFLPMALSTADGAEVQRPLATVVIGGLLTATVLTLMVLPAIYETFTKKQ
ncbi:MAG: efflux RND transporter permease subunit [Prevotellaceae bacterium]|nr:efflux RND transporter permease subunit [Prevotellaceae bacterium]